MLPSAEANQLATGFKVPLTWMCIEAKYDAQNAQVQTWVDGTEIVALRADGVSTQGVDDVWFNMPPFKPNLTTVFFGWQGFYGPAVELWNGLPRGRSDPHRLQLSSARFRVVRAACAS